MLRLITIIEALLRLVLLGLMLLRLMLLRLMLRLMLLWLILLWRRLIDILLPAGNQILRGTWGHIRAVVIIIIALPVLSVLPIKFTLLRAIKTAVLLILIVVVILILVLLPLEAGIDHAVIVIGVLKIALSKDTISLQGCIATKREILI